MRQSLLNAGLGEVNYTQPQRYKQNKILNINNMLQIMQIAQPARVSGLHHATQMNAKQGKKPSWRGANGQQTVLNELNFQAGGSLDPLQLSLHCSQNDLT